MKLDACTKAEGRHRGRRGRDPRRRRLRREQARRLAATASDKTLVFGVAGDPKVLDPSFASDGESFRVARQIYETLVRPEEGGAKIVAGLAEKWEPDSAGTDWTFKLSKGVKFHDGTDFNAEAVCFNFNRWYNCQGPDAEPGRHGVLAGHLRRLRQERETPSCRESLFKSCAAKDASTAVITITRVTSKFPAALMLPSFSISSPKALKKYEADNVGGTADNITYPPYATDAPDRHRPVQVREVGHRQQDGRAGAQRRLLGRRRPRSRP